MKSGDFYDVKSFDLHGLVGISDRTLEMHLTLYEGYVKAANQLTAQNDEKLKDGRIDQEEMPAYSELTRRLGFEYNGMVLHEYYFENLTKVRASDPDRGSAFVKAAEGSFGTYDLWKLDFSSVGKMRGVGWSICYVNPHSGRLSNHWISLHENGNVAGFIPVLVMDVWEQPSAYARRQAWARVTEPLLQVLRPGIIVALGQKAGDVLDQQCVFGLGQNPYELVTPQGRQLHADGETSLQFGNQIGWLHGMKGARGDEQDMVGLPGRIWS